MSASNIGSAVFRPGVVSFGIVAPATPQGKAFAALKKAGAFDADKKLNPANFLAAPTSSLKGIGPATEARLSAMKIKTVAQLGASKVSFPESKVVAELKNAIAKACKDAGLSL